MALYDPASKVTGVEAVSSALPGNPALAAIGTLATDARLDRGELTLTVAPESIVSACEAVKAAGYNFFETVTAVDWLPSEPRFVVTYHILSQSLKARLRLAAWVDSADPVIASIVPVWPAANFYEREVFDLFGIRFSNHPNLTRIMMPEDWLGNPLRKDYPVEGYR